MNLQQKLLWIQCNLKPETSTNNFTKTSYFSLNDILVALKPLLLKTRTLLNFEESITQIGAYLFVKSTIIFKAIDKTEDSSEDKIEVSSYAPILFENKKTDACQQLTSAITYSHKNALKALLLLSDPVDYSILMQQQPAPAAAPAPNPGVFSSAPAPTPVFDDSDDDDSGLPFK